MTETVAIRKFDTMLSELAKPGYTLDYRDFTLQPLQTRLIEATDHTYVVLDAGDSVVVRSELGVYDHVTTTVAESVHHHTGRIVLENHSSTEMQYVEFVIAIWH